MGSGEWVNDLETMIIMMGGLVKVTDELEMGDEGSRMAAGPWRVLRM